jgi:hypothetical protein
MPIILREMGNTTKPQMELEIKPQSPENRSKHQQSDIKIFSSKTLEASHATHQMKTKLLRFPETFCLQGRCRSPTTEPSNASSLNVQHSILCSTPSIQFSEFSIVQFGLVVFYMPIQFMNEFEVGAVAKLEWVSAFSLGVTNRFL